ncbi:hypothetical protein DOTSEDRAFT_27232 [Dothistroma septosporum NZE10]|uniref:F-box domain-containing protein n=1 Tax=Dothistroma septosporum (strain NZE10 / CBS 128990) TaxID=675120 RepID=N1PDB9_DOTSN|nr:hypothetical protein DOTSEDRAFT_27232 [Dothistroma septosporum NZE10]
MARELKTCSKQAVNPQANLLALPQELRDQIYHYVFEGLLVKLDARTVHRRNAGLLATSRQLYIESVDLYYKSATFFLTHDCVNGVESDEKRLMKWLKALPSRRRKLIREIRYEFPGVYGLQRSSTCACYQWTRFAYDKQRQVYTRMQRMLADRGLKLQLGVLKFRVRRHDCGWTEYKFKWSSFGEGS